MTLYLYNINLSLRRAIFSYFHSFSFCICLRESFPSARRPRWSRCRRARFKVARSWKVVHGAHFPALRETRCASPWVLRHEYREFLAAANALCDLCVPLVPQRTHNARFEFAATRDNNSRVNSRRSTFTQQLRINKSISFRVLYIYVENLRLTDPLIFAQELAQFCVYDIIMRIQLL